MRIRPATEEDILAMRLEKPPQWRDGDTPDTRQTAYCIEEVERQGHDTTVQDGQKRVAWMLEAWRWTRGLAKDGQPITRDAVEQIGRLIEREKNHDGFRTRPVYIAGHVRRQDVETIRHEVAVLCRDAGEIDALSWYKRFEEIHPFIDGNGRTGKVMLNWLIDRWDDPLFPPKDLFGYPIRNP